MFGRWLTCWLAGREACLVWGSVVLVQCNLTGGSGCPKFCRRQTLSRTGGTHTQTQEPCTSRDQTQTGGSQTSTICLSNVFVQKALQTLKNLTQSSLAGHHRATAGPRLVHAFAHKNTHVTKHTLSVCMGTQYSSGKVVTRGVLKMLILVNFPPFSRKISPQKTNHNKTPGLRGEGS